MYVTLHPETFVLVHDRAEPCLHILSCPLDCRPETCFVSSMLWDQIFIGPHTIVDSIIVVRNTLSPTQRRLTKDCTRIYACVDCASWIITVLKVRCVLTGEVATCNRNSIFTCSHTVKPAFVVVMVTKEFELHLAGPFGTFEVATVFEEYIAFRVGEKACGSYYAREIVAVLCCRRASKQPFLFSLRACESIFEFVDVALHLVLLGFFLLFDLELLFLHL